MQKTAPKILLMNFTSRTIHWTLFKVPHFKTLSTRTKPGLITGHFPRNLISKFNEKQFAESSIFSNVTKVVQTVKSFLPSIGNSKSSWPKVKQEVCLSFLKLFSQATQSVPSLSEHTKPNRIASYNSNQFQSNFWKSLLQIVQGWYSSCLIK